MNTLKNPVASCRNDTTGFQNKPSADNSTNVHGHPRLNKIRARKPFTLVSVPKSSESTSYVKPSTRKTGKLTGAACQCSVGHEIFERVTGFDAHRVNGICLNANEMITKGMVINKRGRWGTKHFKKSTIEMIKHWAAL